MRTVAGAFVAAGDARLSNIHHVRRHFSLLQDHTRWPLQHSRNTRQKYPQKFPYFFISSQNKVPKKEAFENCWELLTLLRSQISLEGKIFSRAYFSCTEAYEMYPRLTSPKIEYVEL